MSKSQVMNFKRSKTILESKKSKALSYALSNDEEENFENSFNENSDLITNPIFKKIQSLKKILNRFNSKTSKIKKEDDESLEVLIKLEICKILDFFIKKKEDYHIDNFISFFHINYIEKMKNNFNEQEYDQVLPESTTEIGKNITKIKNKFSKSDFKCFDEILERPLLEILMIAFYFTNNSKLQNSLIDLTFKICNQKISFIGNVSKLQLLFSIEQIKTYQSINDIVEKISTFISDSQVFVFLIF